MRKLRAAVIGCGAPRRTGAEGWKIGYAHAEAYAALESTELVAAADINPENLAAFAGRFDVPAAYLDYREMLARERIDIVSICTWVGLHAEITVAAAESGVRGILCEKPMALSMSEADRMLAACRANGVQFALNTQRRFGEPWVTAKKLIDTGEIGTTLQFEGSCPDWDLLEWGTHWVDMCRFFASESPASWVFAQVDASQGKRIFGHLVENDAVVRIGFENGFTGTLYMGEHAPRDFSNRILGSDGVVVIAGENLKYLSAKSRGWVELEVPKGPDAIAASVDALVTAVHTGVEAPHGASGARAVTEITLAAYHSAVENRLIRLPLDAKDFPLERLAARYQRERLNAGDS